MGEYQGWDIKTPKGILPASFIFKEGLEQTPNQIMDLDPRRTAEGLLVRNILPYKVTSIRITTVPMGLSRKKEFQSYFPSRETIEIEYWNEETNTYCKGNFYIPDVTWKRYGKVNGEPYYLSTVYELIGYGEKN